jgi:hypothetical protein
MKEDFINKWSCFWMLHTEKDRLNKAFISQLEAVIEDERQKLLNQKTVSTQRVPLEPPKDREINLGGHSRHKTK